MSLAKDFDDRIGVKDPLTTYIEDGRYEDGYLYFKLAGVQEELKVSALDLLSAYTENQTQRVKELTKQDAARICEIIKKNISEGQG